MVFAAAAHYSTVGHAGASGYLAAMALLGAPVAMMKPTALVLNILVASLATVCYYRASCFAWSAFWPFVVASIPAAFIGGAVQLCGAYYKPLVGVILLVAAAHLFWSSRKSSDDENRSPAVPLLGGIVSGAGIGLLSGLTGTGGGIFLSPLLLFMSWTGTRRASGVSAAFILVNSIAGLTGNLVSLRQLPDFVPLLASAAFLGASLGTWLGTRKLGNQGLRRALAVVLVVAGLKLLFP
jgi:uncharacterized membrane protein YfcA